MRHDVSSEDDWEAAVAAALDAFGRLDIVINMAGRSHAGSVEETTLEDWRRVMEVNLDGVFLGTKHGIGGDQAERRRLDRQHFFDLRLGGGR